MHTVKGGGEEKKNMYSIIGILLAEYCVLWQSVPYIPHSSLISAYFFRISSYLCYQCFVILQSSVPCQFGLYPCYITSYCKLRSYHLRTLPLPFKVCLVI